MKKSHREKSKNNKVIFTGYKRITVVCRYIIILLLAVIATETQAKENKGHNEVKYVTCDTIELWPQENKTEECTETVHVDTGYKISRLIDGIFGENRIWKYRSITTYESSELCIPYGESVQRFTPTGSTRYTYYDHNDSVIYIHVESNNFMPIYAKFIDTSNIYSDKVGKSLIVNSEGTVELFENDTVLEIKHSGKN